MTNDVDHILIYFPMFLILHLIYVMTLKNKMKTVDNIKKNIESPKSWLKVNLLRQG